MTSKILQDQSTELVKDIQIAINNQTAPWLKEWGLGELLQPRNALTGRPYNGQNLLKLSLQNHKDPRWATFEEVGELGGSIKKGEKGTRVVFLKNNTSQVVSYSLFNLEQTTLSPYINQTFNQQEREELEKSIQNKFKRLNVKIEQGDGFSYNLQDDKIITPPLKNSSDEYSQLSKLLSYWATNNNRIDAKATINSPSKMALMAELHGFFVSIEKGLPFTPSKDESYIHEWGKTLSVNKAKELLEVCPIAQKTKILLIGQNKHKYLPTQIDKSSEKVLTTEEINQDDFLQEAFFKNIPREQALRELNLVERTYLLVPFEEKEKAKQLGAKWDNLNACWYVNSDNNSDVSKYIPSSFNAGGLSVDDFIAQAKMIDVSIESLVFNEKTRIPLISKPKGKNGEYKLYSNSDGSIAGYVKNYATGEATTWSNKNKNELTANEKKWQQASSKNRKYLANKVRKFTQDKKSEFAKKIIDILPNASSKNPYVVAKKMKHIEELKEYRGQLVVPLYDGNRISSLQLIMPNGDKRLMKQGSKEGSFFSMGNKMNPNKIFISEGLSTAEAILQANDPSDTLSISAVDANNLKSVSEKIKKLYPHKDLVVCADNDYKFQSLDNVGIQKAKETGFNFITPPTLDASPTDWNDVLVKKGIDYLKSEVDKQMLTNEVPNLTFKNEHVRTMGSTLYKLHQSLTIRNVSIEDQLAVMNKIAKKNNVEIDAQKLRQSMNLTPSKKFDAFTQSVKKKIIDKGKTRDREATKTI